MYHTCTNCNRFGVFIRWNRRLLTKYRHENWHFCWFYLNMDKPTASKNRLKSIYCPTHQIDIPPAQILSSNSTISSKVLSERVLLPNIFLTFIWDMSCFLRASVLLSKEQYGTVRMANKYKLASILLSILIIQRGQKRLTPLWWLTAWWCQSIWSQAKKRAKVKLRIHESCWKSKVLYYGMAYILPYKAKRRYLLTCKVSR